MDVVNSGFHVFFPLRQIGGSDVEHRIGIVADGGGGRTAFADLPPFGQDGFVVNVRAVVADAVQVFGRHAVVADEARGFSSLKIWYIRAKSVLNSSGVSSWPSFSANQLSMSVEMVR